MREMLGRMLGTWRQQHLPEIVANLANRPGHEAVRTHVADILRYGFGVAYHEIDHEVRLPEVHGRADTLFGSVVFEFKRDLRQELADVFARLPDYLAEREQQTGRRSKINCSYLPELSAAFPNKTSRRNARGTARRPARATHG